MKYLCVIVCLILPFIGFSQTKEEIKLMLTDYCHYRHGIDSNTQKIILENAWQWMYYYNKKLSANNVEQINEKSALTFERDSFLIISLEDYKVAHFGKYFFNKNFLFLLFGAKENTAYKIINLIDDEYLIVELYSAKKKGTFKSSKSIHRRLLLQKAGSMPCK
jgi:hypothetical protein